MAEAAHVVEHRDRGLAGSFAVLAGAAAVSPQTLQPLPLMFALVLFLWTPPHFWSLAIAFHDDYAAAKVPMLPVVVGDVRAARAVLAGSALLVAASLAPAWFGMGRPYLVTAIGAGAYLLVKSASSRERQAGVRRSPISTRRSPTLRCCWAPRSLTHC